MEPQLEKILFNIVLFKVLIISEPLSSAPLPSMLHTHCNWCTTNLSLMAPLECAVCSSAIYCDTSCLNKAIQSFHQWECHVNAQNLYALCHEVQAKSDLYMLLLALRGFTIKSPSFFFEEKRSLFDAMECQAEDPADLHELCLSLVTHYNALNILDILCQGLVGLHLLRRSAFLLRDHDALLTMKLMVHFNAVLRSNNHQVQGELSVIVRARVIHGWQGAGRPAHLFYPFKTPFTYS
jgi:hypothetical protein